MMSKVKEITERFPEETFLFVDGFEDAILGVDLTSFRVIYSISKCKEILVKDGFEPFEAEEYLFFNTIGAYVGEKTPIWCEDI